MKNLDIVWFDVETTGINTTNDRIIEICLIKTDFDGNEIIQKDIQADPKH